MNRNLAIQSQKLIFVTAFLMIPTGAQAQNIPLPIAIGIVSPLFVFLLCVALGILRRSAMSAFRHIGLMIIWVTLFAIASHYVDNDYIIWTPLAIYVGHSIMLLALVFKELWKRSVRRHIT
jgi:hypothetical protein